MGCLSKLCMQCPKVKPHEITSHQQLYHCSRDGELELTKYAFIYIYTYYNQLSFILFILITDHLAQHILVSVVL